MKQLAFKVASVLACVGMSCWGQVIDDPLHGYCSVGCMDNGNNSPTSQNPIAGFGFNISPGPQTGDLLIDILVPNDQPQSASYALTGTLSGTAAQFSGTAWSSGGLDTFLGLAGGASPANPIGAFLDTSETALNPTATSFFVYQVDFGTQTLPANPSTGISESISGGIPLGSYIVGFLDASRGWVATAPSGAILETSDAPSPAPEPTSIILLGSVALGLVSVLKKKVRSHP